MAADADDILDSPFHGCALAAYLDQAAEERGWPSREGTRRRAFDYYEQALREKNAAKRPAEQGRWVTSGRLTACPLTPAVELYRTIQTPRTRP